MAGQGRAFGVVVAHELQRGPLVDMGDRVVENQKRLDGVGAECGQHKPGVCGESRRLIARRYKPNDLQRAKATRRAIKCILLRAHAVADNQIRIVVTQHRVDTICPAATVIPICNGRGGNPHGCNAGESATGDGYDVVGDTTAMSPNQGVLWRVVAGGVFKARGGVIFRSAACACIPTVAGNSVGRVDERVICRRAQLH